VVYIGLKQLVEAKQDQSHAARLKLDASGPDILGTIPG
jgi:hypothetical protein